MDNGIRSQVVQIDDFDRALFDHFSKSQHEGINIEHIAKRTLDIVVSSASLIVLAPVIGLASLINLSQNGSPTFFNQERLGQFGKKFTMYKLRTMKNGTMQNLRQYVDLATNKFGNMPQDSDAYTPFGRFMDKYHINELPQLLNVLKGDMSLVGNRPLPMYVARSIGSSENVLERYSSPQGITGYSQIKGRDNVSDTDRIMMEKKYSELYDNGGVFVEDLKILWKTVLITSMSPFQSYLQYKDKAMCKTHPV